jgi:fatty aldehyde decarbonylase
MTEPSDLKPRSTPDEVRQKVLDGYTSVAEGHTALATEDPDAHAEAFGYRREAVRDAPAESNLGLGCGDPTGGAGLRIGETVLDLGCGAGIDVFIASKAVGASGRAIGVDMTEALLAKARATAEREGYDNVEFRLGTMEALPVDDDSVDVIVSNCAINLSPEKERVFAEAMRVLKPGGRIQLSDLVVDEDLPAEVQASVEAYVGCVGGAIRPEAYTELVRSAGFTDVEVTVTFSLGDFITPDDPRVQAVIDDSGAHFADDEIRDSLSHIKGLSVRAQAGDTTVCCAPGLETATTPAPAPRPSALSQPAPAIAGSSDTGYRDLLSYVVSNAVAGEIMAVENYSDMVSLLDDVDAKIEAVDQAREEGRHVKQLASLGPRLGFDVKQRIIEPEWKSIRATFRSAVAAGNLAACLIIQDLMTESVAIVLYQTLSGTGADVDELTSDVAATILDDELKHLGIGVARLRQMRATDSAAVDEALAWAQPLVMPQLFSLMSTSCESLCDELSLDCATLDPGALGADLDMIRARVAIQYMEAIDAVGFADEIVEPLMAQLAALEQDDPSSRVTAGPEPSCC